MRWFAAAAVLSCGCNQVFDIKATLIADASRPFFDGPIDAAPTCPASGTVPKFAKLFHQLDVSSCTEYQTSQATDLALARCGNATVSVGVGRIDDTMTAAVGFDPGVNARGDVRLAPEGNLAFMTLVPAEGIAVYSLAEYDRDALGNWTTGPAIPIPLGVLGNISTMTRASLGRRLFVTSLSGTMDEYVEDDQAQWSDVATYGASDFGLADVGDPQLSPDGLRMVMAGTPTSGNMLQTYYVDRPDLTSRFGMPTQIDAIPGVTDAFLTEDCGRLYFSAIDTVFYVQRE